MLRTHCRQADEEILDEEDKKAVDDDDIAGDTLIVDKAKGKRKGSASDAGKVKVKKNKK